MDIRLDEKTAEMVKELANTTGLSFNEVVQKIIQWYIEDCFKEN